MAVDGCFLYFVFRKGVVYCHVYLTHVIFIFVLLANVVGAERKVLFMVHLTIAMFTVNNKSLWRANHI